MMFGDNGQPDMETIAMKNELQDLIEKMDSMNKVSIFSVTTFNSNCNSDHQRKGRENRLLEDGNCEFEEEEL